MLKVRTSAPLPFTKSNNSEIDFKDSRATQSPIHEFKQRGFDGMVLTKEELIAALQNEVRILLHLAGKIDRAKLDYRPTPKQRSPIELLRYLSIMGPFLVQ